MALNVVFRHPAPPAATAEEDWDEVFIQRADFRGADQTDPLVVRTEKGYTGDPPQSRLDILKHSQFRDVRARIYAKYSSSQWVEIGSRRRAAAAARAVTSRSVPHPHGFSARAVCPRVIR